MHLISLILTFFLASCLTLKTDEQIQKDRVVQGLPGQVEQSQKLLAQMTLRMNELESRLQNYTGEIEEIEYRQQKLIPDTQKVIQDQIADQAKEIRSLRTEISDNQKLIEKLENKIEQQQTYITKVNSTLTKLSQAPAPSLPKVEKKSEPNDYLNGLFHFRKKDYSEAEKDLLSALKNQKLNAAEVNKAYQALGHIEFSRKNYEKSNVYFSKIFTKYPRSSMAPDALIHMARAFKGQKNANAAKQAYKTFLKEYPKHNLASSAEKELNAL